MSAKVHYVKNRKPTLRCFNLPTKDHKGRRQSLHLARNEVSRALTEEEFTCQEIQNGLKAQTLLDVTRQKQRGA